MTPEHVSLTEYFVQEVIKWILNELGIFSSQVSGKIFSTLCLPSIVAVISRLAPDD